MMIYSWLILKVLVCDRDKIEVKDAGMSNCIHNQFKKVLQHLFVENDLLPNLNKLRHFLRIYSFWFLCVCLAVTCEFIPWATALTVDMLLELCVPTSES
jgi:hypothetical protein